MTITLEDKLKQLPIERQEKIKAESKKLIEAEYSKRKKVLGARNSD